MTRVVPIWVAVAVLLAFTSCSDKSPSRVDVWGTVKFKNQPVPAGLIVINPDFSKGNDGPQGLAEIRDGRFDTRNLAKGAPSGPVTFMIDGFDGVPQGEATQGRPLFISYKLSLDLPNQPTEKNIDVPDSAGANAKTATGPLP